MTRPELKLFDPRLDDDEEDDKALARFERNVIHPIVTGAWFAWLVIIGGSIAAGLWWVAELFSV